MTQICWSLRQWISERAGMDTYFVDVDHPEQGPAVSAVFRLRGMKPAEPHLDDTQAGYYDERSGHSLKLYHGFPQTGLRSILSSERAVRGERGRGHMCGIFAAEELETALHYAAADYLTVHLEERWPSMRLTTESVSAQKTQEDDGQPICSSRELVSDRGSLDQALASKRSSSTSRFSPTV